MMKQSNNRHPGESRGPGLNPGFKIKFKDWIPAFAGMTILLSVGFVHAAPPKIELPPLEFTPGQAERITLKNGIVVFLKEDHELPVFDMNIRIKISPADVKKADAIGFFGGLWRSGGTLKLTPDQLNDELEFLPASIEATATDELVGLSLSCLSKDMTRSLEIFTDILLTPRFDPEQLSLAKAKSMEGLRRKNETPPQIARRLFRDVVYGESHPYAFESTPATIKEVLRADLQELHKKVVVPDNAIIAVAGDFNRDELIAALEKNFFTWKQTGRVVPKFDYSIKTPAPGKIFFVQKDSNQSRISMGMAGLARHSPDHFTMELADYILGGGGPSRLFGEVRSRLGLAYMVGSFNQEPVGPGLIGVACQTKAKSTMQAIKAIQSELDKFVKAPVTDAELRLAKDSIANSYVFGFDSAFSVANTRAGNEFFGYSIDYPDIYTGRTEAVTKEEILKAGRKYYAKEKMKIVIVGNEKDFDAPLSTLGEVITVPLEKVN